MRCSLFLGIHLVGGLPEIYDLRFLIFEVGSF